MTRSEIFKFLILRTIGNFLVIFAIFGVFATIGPAIYYELIFKVMQVRGVSFAVVTNKVLPIQDLLQQNKTDESPGFSDIVTGPKQQILTPIDTEFSILIPKIGAKAKIYPNIDPSSAKIFLPILQKGVAHSKGTFFPGQKGNIYLFAHSTDNFWDVGRYNAVFYLLKDLKVGDDIVVFYQNIRHDYAVKNSVIANPSEVSFITKPATGHELLILQTCWPPGTTWKRLMVFAQPK